MERISSICVYLRNMSDRFCCCSLKSESSVEKSEYQQTSQHVIGQSSFYISTSNSDSGASLTPHPSTATTVSKNNSEDIQNWYEIDLPAVYRPLSTSNKNPEAIHRISGDGKIIFLPEHPDNYSNMKKLEIPGIHNTTNRNQTNFWTMTKDRLLRNRRDMQMHSSTMKLKSQEMKPNDTEESSDKLRKDVLESDL